MFLNIHFHRHGKAQLKSYYRAPQFYTLQSLLPKFAPTHQCRRIIGGRAQIKRKYVTAATASTCLVLRPRLFVYCNTCQDAGGVRERQPPIIFPPNKCFIFLLPTLLCYNKYISWIFLIHAYKCVFKNKAMFMTQNNLTR